MTEYCYPGYETVLCEKLSDMNAEGILLRHKKTGARVALIPNEDENKVFYIAFRTPPLDETGAAHIVEHTVLCGSEKYPLKDPFIALAKGSVNTYLNATTYPDKTMYPVASTNQQDFKNLVDVYLDAVFHPNIAKEKNIFLQEGWSYHLEKPDDPLTISGVVYNEMKGAYSSPDELLEAAIVKSLFPNTPYGLDAGGNPECIPDLSYDKYLAFYEKYYHPSNAYLYFYGNLDMAEMLSYVDREYLSAYEKRKIESEIPAEKPFSKPVRKEAYYPVSEEDADAGDLLALSVVVGTDLPMKTVMAMYVLDYALFSMPGAPVKEALLSEGIGEEIYGSFSDGIRQPYFSIVAKDVPKASADRFYEIVREILTKVVEEGVDKNALLAGLNSLAFQAREADYSIFPKGLVQGVNCLDTWLYEEENPFAPLQSLDAIAELQKEAEEETSYFRDLIQSVFLCNPHASFVVLHPDTGGQERAEEALAKALEKKKKSFSNATLLGIQTETTGLRAWQEMDDPEEALRSIPCIHTGDLRKEPHPFSNIEKILPGKPGGLLHKTVVHSVKDNRIGRIGLYFSLAGFDEEQLFYASLLRAVLMSVDTKQHTYQALANEINMRTGGITTGISIFEPKTGTELVQPFFILRGKAFYPAFSELMYLCKEVLLDSLYTDTKRIGEILREMHTHLSMSLAEGGGSLGVTRAVSLIDPIGKIMDAVEGVAFYDRLTKLDTVFEENNAEISAALRRTAVDLFRPERLLVSLTCAPEEEELCEKALSEFFAEADSFALDNPKSLPLPPAPHVLNKSRAEGYSTAGQVQYIALCGHFSKGEALYHGSLQVVKHILSYGYLWDEVRVKGNAYGCGISFSRTGLMTMTSYRDPEIQRTVAVFQGAADALEVFDASQEEMEKYVIGTIGTLDTPKTDSMFEGYCMRVYLTGLTAEELAKTREEIFATRAEDVRAAASLVRKALESSAMCVLGSEKAIRKARALFDTVRPLS